LQENVWGTTKKALYWPRNHLGKGLTATGNRESSIVGKKGFETREGEGGRESAKIREVGGRENREGSLNGEGTSIKRTKNGKKAVRKSFSEGPSYQRKTTARTEKCPEGTVFLPSPGGGGVDNKTFRPLHEGRLYQK